MDIWENNPVDVDECHSWPTKFIDKAKKHICIKKRAALYKRCATGLFESIEHKLKEIGCSARIIDVEFGNGYFVFYYGDNSVVHFGIDKLPGWKFGLWLFECDKPGEISCELFAQREEWIDKFKPSASNISYSFSLKFDRKSVWVNEKTLSKICRKIRYMTEHFFSEIYRDYKYFGDKGKGIPERDAIIWYIETMCKEIRDEYIKNFLDNLIVDFYEREIVPNFNNAEVIYRKNCFPKFELVAPLKDNNNEEKYGRGIYGLEVEDGSLDKLSDMCEYIADILDVYWNVPIYPDIYFYK